MTARQVREEIESFRPMTHGAVVTLLGRLEKKAMIAKKKGPVGKAFLFEAISKADEPVRNWLSSTLKRVFQGDEVAFVASLFETKPPTPAEVEQLQALLDELRRKRKREN